MKPRRLAAPRDDAHPPGCTCLICHPTKPHPGWCTCVVCERQKPAKAAAAPTPADEQLLRAGPASALVYVDGKLAPFDHVPPPQATPADPPSAPRPRRRRPVPPAPPTPPVATPPDQVRRFDVPVHDTRSALTSTPEDTTLSDVLLIEVLEQHGYQVQFRWGTWWECAITSGEESWIGAGATEDAALHVAVGRMCGSRLARTLLEHAVAARAGRETAENRGGGGATKPSPGKRAARRRDAALARTVGRSPAKLADRSGRPDRSKPDPGRAPPARGDGPGAAGKPPGAPRNGGDGT